MPLDTSSPTPTTRSPKAIGVGAGLLAFGLVLGLLAGVLWGFLHPTYVIEITDGTAVIDAEASDESAEFTAIGWLTILSAVVGAALALVAWFKTGGGGIGTLIWVMAVAAAAAFTIVATGQVVAQALHDVPPDHATSGTFTVAPAVNPHVAWLVAPFVSALLYWMLNFFAFSAERSRRGGASR